MGGKTVIERRKIRDEYVDARYGFNLPNYYYQFLLLIVMPYIEFTLC